jgi:D-hydroxyproline dehydrogenase subunit alpha
MSRAVEVAVVGGGPGGLSAALAAARAGAQVTLLDGYTRPGGQYYRQPPDRLMARATRRQRQGRALWQQARDAGVEILSDWVVWDAAPDRTLAAAGPDGTTLIHPAALVLATGSYERLAAFPGWTLPGVMTSGAAQALLYQGVAPGKRVLLVGAGPLQLTTAAELLHAGVEVAAVLEAAPVLRKILPHAAAMWGQWERAVEGLESVLALASRGVPYRTGWGIVSAYGEGQVEGARIARLDADWRPVAGSEREVACDTICIGYGFIPFNALSRLAGAQQEWRPELGGEIPLRDKHMQTTMPGIFAAGDGAGLGGYRSALLEGQIAGLAAAAFLGRAGLGQESALRGLARRLERERAFQRLYSSLFAPELGLYELAQPDTLICRCEGVTLGDLQAAVRENGAASFVEAKNITRCGMGECQGRVCGQMIPQIISRLSGVSPEQVGSNAPRPPLFALPLHRLRAADQAAAGRSFERRL